MFNSSQGSTTQEEEKTAGNRFVFSRTVDLPNRNQIANEIPA